MNPSPELVPEMLNWIQIRGKSWPVHLSNILVSQKVSRKTCTMNLVHVLRTVQISVDSVEIIPLTKADASPHHDRPSTVPVMLLYGGVLEPHPASPPHTIPAVVE